MNFWAMMSDKKKIKSSYYNDDKTVLQLLQLHYHLDINLQDLQLKIFEQIYLWSFFTLMIETL